MKTGDFKKTSTLSDIDLSGIQDTGSEASEADNEGSKSGGVSEDIDDTGDDFIENTGEEGVDEDSSQAEDTNVETGGSDNSNSDASKIKAPEEVSEELILKRLSEKLGREVKSFDELTESKNPLDKDPYLKGLADWREKTGRPIEDWIKLHLKVVKN